MNNNSLIYLTRRIRPRAFLDGCYYHNLRGHSSEVKIGRIGEQLFQCVANSVLTVEYRDWVQATVGNIPDVNKMISVTKVRENVM